MMNTRRQTLASMIHSAPPWGAQRGALTIFTGVFVLILMTLMLLYATRVGVFEQRTSSNDMRYKLAFHAAESALDQMVEYLLANNDVAMSSSPEAGPDGLNTDPPGYRAGWFFDDPATKRWQQCTDANVADGGHPCYGLSSEASRSFYYDTDGDPGTVESLPVNVTGMAPGTTARATVTLCMLQFGSFGTMDCDSATPDPGNDDVHVLATLIGYGYSDCEDRNGSGVIEDDEIPFCKGKASVSVPYTSLHTAGGGVGVPLVTKNSLPTSGTVEIVANPNAGGVGVPMAVWANGGTTCPPKDSSGGDSDALAHQATSWATCHRHEWFGVDYWPDPLECPGPTCACTTDELISGAVGGGDIVVNADIQVDPTFPCDLFEFYFNVPRDMYEVVKSNAQVYDDCSRLGPASSGLIWISGPSCLIGANTVVGSEDHPVLLVLAAAGNDIRGGAVVYGTVFVTDVEVPGATFEANGTMTVFGQVVVDSLFRLLNGTFQVVYDEGIVSRSSGTGTLGQLNHGWRDWGLPDITW